MRENSVKYGHNLGQTLYSESSARASRIAACELFHSFSTARSTPFLSSRRALMRLRL